MAVLTATRQSRDLLFPAQFRSSKSPTADHVMETWLITEETAIAATTEWIATGLSEITAVIGVSFTGTTAQNLNPYFILNAQGTSVAAGTDPGDLGIESTAAITASTIVVTIIGKA